MSNKNGISFKSELFRHEKLLGVHYLVVNAAVIKKLGGKLAIRLLCRINSNPAFQCGMVALGDGKAYITVNNKRMKEFGLKNGDKIQVELSQDESKYGMDVPDELTELLKQDKEGRKRFDQLSPGKQRYIIFYVGGVKDPQKRIDRAILLITNLKTEPLGKESFARLLGKK